MKKKGIFVILFILNLALLSAKLSANPFTGKKNSPTPVYQGQPSENILKGQSKNKVLKILFYNM